VQISTNRINKHIFLVEMKYFGVAFGGQPYANETFGDPCIRKKTQCSKKVMRLKYNKTMHRAICLLVISLVIW
jgi:hypothetical protein